MTTKSYAYEPQWQLPPGVRACVTTVTAPGNVASHVGDDPATVLRHRRELQRALELPQQPKWLAQYHSTAVVKAETVAMGAPADAIWTLQPRGICAVLTADCLPILLASNDGEVIAAMHAGWRGLAHGIVAATVAQLPVPAQHLSAYIGPAISQPHFEVGDEVRTAFVSQGLVDTMSFAPHKPGKWLGNLALLAERTLRQSGVTNVTQSGLCTYSDDRFYSYRRQPQCGRIASLIWKI